MGLALPILAPGGVASALTHWGSADQQATYLKEFAGDNVPQACLTIAEPHPLFDPTMLKTIAVRTPGGYRLDQPGKYCQSSRISKMEQLSLLILWNHL